MSPANLVIAAAPAWKPGLAERVAARTGCPCRFVGRPEDLSPVLLAELAPRYVFFPHWSYRIPREIFERHECVIFHMTDLPFGRGGSPLQNLISRGIYETRVSALRCNEALDAGPVYLKRSLSLYGSAQEIYMRATDIIEEMIVTIINEQPVPLPQSGEPVQFRRRTPVDGDIANLETLVQVFDFIRMLDADGYPSAFVEVGNFRFEFRRASFRGDEIVADVIIRKRP